MDWLTFIPAMTKAPINWPMVVGWILLLLRKPFRGTVLTFNQVMAHGFRRP